MSSRKSPFSDLDNLIAGSGVARYAVVHTGPVPDEEMERFYRWTTSGCHASMDYLMRHRQLRSNPAFLLDGVKSMVCCVIPYPSPLHLPPHKANIAAYALGDDYHDVVRDMLSGVANRIKETYGGEVRVCVDTAPLPERYWTVRSGLGFRGLNGHVFIPGLGSFFFLGEILSTAILPVTLNGPCPTECTGCGACVRACPTGALNGDGTVDARRCLSYLTIEHRGEFPEGTDLHGHLYGCDVCGAVCPLNRTACRIIVDRRLQPRQELLELTVREAAEMNQEQFSLMFHKSAVKRAKLSGLRRNAISIDSGLRPHQSQGHSQDGQEKGNAAHP